MNRQPIRLTTQTEVSASRILVCAPENVPLADLLQSRLSLYDSIVDRRTDLPADLQSYSIVFTIDASEHVFKQAFSKSHRKLVFIYLNLPARADAMRALVKNYQGGSVKIISLTTTAEHYPEDIEKILWFSFTHSSEVFLPIEHFTPQQHAIKHQLHSRKRFDRKRIAIRKRIASLAKPRNAVLAILAVVGLLHLAFLPVLAGATYLTYRAAVSLWQRDTATAVEYARLASFGINSGQWLYAIVRPTYSLFSLAILPDDAFLLNRTTIDVVKNAAFLEQRGETLRDLILQTGKTSSDVEYIGQIAESLFSTIRKTANDLSILKSKIPRFDSRFDGLRLTVDSISDAIKTVQPFFPYFGWILGENAERKYLILFANNMELRPGGGFIGSFAVVKVKDYTLMNLDVYDVYDADGQLQAHVRPPAPIREYLDQPHWFLRDSAFSPDFTENASQAKFFLDRTMNIRDFDGVILITTSAVQNILAAMDELYIPDFRERVTSDNFYIKAQLYAEKNFFPGSRQKKTFLGAVMNQMLIDITEASPDKLFSALIKSLNEKQIVMSFSNRELQSLIDANYWAGRTIAPVCTISSNPNCIVDYLFPYDANLGVNKANFFITKRHEFKVTILPDGTIRHRLRILYANESEPQVFPGGPYRNYFQLLLPKNVRITGITNMGKKLDSYDLQSGEITRIGFLSTVAPQQQGEIVIDYEYGEKAVRGNGIYQLILQKQIGSPNSDFALEIEKPDNFYVVNKNFSPIVKGNRIIYNTSLSADKIFFLEFFLE
ncbi:MAG: DUF4012 domain-containing protein [Patescibacteria group bacterium]|nr:DUF4012 domain-containing protein [Patescibacteria group bacterium]